MRRKILTIGVIILAGVVGLSYYLIFQKHLLGKGPWGGEPAGFEGLTPLGLDIINPLENAPQTNPLEKVANPFKEAYKNPFAQ